MHRTRTLAALLGERAREMTEPKHCDSYIDSLGAPKCLRWFLFVNRLPATLKSLAREKAGEPRLFATYEGQRVRVVMASRMGDVGITEDLRAEHGYTARVWVQDLSEFSEVAA